MNAAATIVVYLEMFAHDQRDVPAPRDGLSVVHAQSPSVTDYRFLYHAVGEHYDWTSRKRLSDADLAAIVQHPLNDLHVLHVEDSPAGFCELDRRQPDQIELKYFGLMPEYTGQRLGSWFLNWTVETAWNHAPKRLWLHTCSQDHPAAVHTYQQAGFRVFKQDIVARHAAVAEDRKPSPKS